MTDINSGTEKLENFFSDLMPPTILPIQEDVGIDIDVDIEKQITQLQEAKMQIGNIKDVSELKDSDYIAYWEEKQNLQKKVAKDKKKIIELESLFNTLKKTEEKKKTKVRKKKVLLVEPEPKKLKEEVNEIKVAEKGINKFI